MSVSVPALPNTRGGVCRSTMNQGEVSMTQRELERSTSRRGWTVRWPLWIAYGSFMRVAKSCYSLVTTPGPAALTVGANAALQRAGHVVVLGGRKLRTHSTPSRQSGRSDTVWVKPVTSLVHK